MVVLAPVQMHLPHIYRKILIVVLAPPKVSSRWFKLLQEEMLMGQVIWGPIWRIIVAIWAKTAKTHISRMDHHMDLVDP